MGAAEWEDENGGGRVNHGVHVLCIQYPQSASSMRVTAARGVAVDDAELPPKPKRPKGGAFRGGKQWGFFGGRSRACCQLLPHCICWFGSVIASP